MKRIKGIFSAAAVLMLVASGGISAQVPPSPYTFTQVHDSSVVHVSGDKKTYTSFIDSDGHRVAGGVFRMQMKNLKPDQKSIAISAVIAVCSEKAVVFMRTKEFTAGGTHGTINEKPVFLKDLTAEDPAMFVFKAICSPEVKPTPLNPRYKAPASYTKFWAEDSK